MMGFGMMGGMLFFWIVLIVISVLAIKGLFNSGNIRDRNKSENARRILDERLARGEITLDQYQTILKDIG
ncbi:MAG: hypothetical protein AAGU15_05635 [Anaerolineaceae bacterium]